MRCSLHVATYLAWLRWVVGQPLTWQLTVFCCVSTVLVLSSELYSPAKVDVTLTPALTQLPVRVSEAGIVYGTCGGVYQAVILFPEPCDWEDAMPRPLLSMR